MRSAKHRDPDCTGMWRVLCDIVLGINYAECDVCNATTSDTVGAQLENSLTDEMRLAANAGRYLIDTGRRPKNRLA